MSCVTMAAPAGAIAPDEGGGGDASTSLGMTTQTSSRCASRASTSSFSSQASNNADAVKTANRKALRHSIAVDASSSRQSKVFATPTKKAKRVRFFRNGDRFFKGVVMPVTPERYRSFDSLLSDVTRTLKDHVMLPNGVRTLYTTDGSKVSTVDDLEDGKCYVCSGQGESFKRIEYLNLSSRISKPARNILNRSPTRNNGITASASSSSALSSIRPRVVTLIRSGIKPRRVVRLLLNKRNTATLEHVFAAITDVVKLDSGAARKVFSMRTGALVASLDAFFMQPPPSEADPLVDDVFFVYGTERVAVDDLQLDPEELKAIQSYKRSLPQYRRLENGARSVPGVMPKMPKKKIAQQGDTNNSLEPVIPTEVRTRYKIGYKIGDGNFAVVRKCVDRCDGVEYAMKIIDKSKCRGREQMIANEVEILRQVKHPRIIRVLAEFDTPTELYLVMELAGGDLFDAIAAVTSFPEDETKLMVSHLVSALAYLHQRHIVHRDVKPENLLVRMDENRKVRSLTLTDFGLAQYVSEPLTAVCGTPTYVAPEILQENGYGLKVDVWAAGVILYILLCGFPPFVSTTDDPAKMQDELFDKILLGEFEFPSPYWDNISVSARDLITCMLQFDADIRFSAEDVLDHPWLLFTDETDHKYRHNTATTPRSSRTPLNVSKQLGFSG